MNLQGLHIQQSSSKFKTDSTISKHSPSQGVHYHKFQLQLQHRSDGGGGVMTLMQEVKHT
jgi:hypothetical protein